ncbi:hypothetical protein JE86ST02C_690 (plasmid) [Escherichia coli]|nr:hypothetical protein JE86ST02C_690 [Escherichia coli]
MGYAIKAFIQNRCDICLAGLVEEAIGTGALGKLIVLEYDTGGLQDEFLLIM